MLPTSAEAMEAAARERMSAVAFAFYASGSFAETSVVENVTAWSKWHVRPRMGIDVRRIDIGTTILGTRIELPVFLAPCGFNRLAHDDGEFGVARACAAEGTVQVLSSASAIAPEEVARVSDAPKWFQLYADNDEAITDERVARAEAAGFQAVVITVDTPALAIRYQGIGDFEVFVQELTNKQIVAPILTFCERLEWTEIERIASTTKLPVVLKGILHPDDAKRAPDHGAGAIIVSNHGGRQMDGSIPPALALPDVVEAVGGRTEVYVDGGVRTGVDVLRALALGARAVLIGRPYLWALAIDGEAGVRELIARFKNEVRSAMALAGQTDATSVDPSIVVRA
ncbi:MAG TPA: alpha-hydroxy acid oxidase [Actinomycetota bacterium]|nr:alpha-hydroxy acid oxidase [Actinomycetota bacterium]